MIYLDNYSSPLGTIMLAERDGCLIGCWFYGQQYFPAFREETKHEKTALLEHTEQWLDDYFSGKQPKISDLPLKPEGGEFRQKVWQILARIPYGETVTYGSIAKQFPGRMSAQAVGGAVGHNPISVIIPCHRVLGSDGSLTGYAGGLHIKKALLKLEGLQID